MSFGHVSEDFRARLSGFYQQGQFTDATIICGPLQLKVHKVILAAHSEYFEAALKADTFKEGKTGEIVLKAADAESNDSEDACGDRLAVAYMVGYFYNHDYDYDKRESLMIHAKTFSLAVKHQILGLRQLAKRHFRNRIIICPFNIKDGELLEVAQYVYTSTPDHVKDLRAIVASELLKRYERLQSTEHQSMIHSVPDLAFDVLELQTQRENEHCPRGHGNVHSGKDLTKCISCGASRPFCYGCQFSTGTQVCADCCFTQLGVVKGISNVKE